MNAYRVGPDVPIPAERLAEASVWIARLHGDDRDHAAEAGFRQWLKAHPLNARAFELTTEVWEASHDLRRVVPFSHKVSTRGDGRARFSPALASIFAAVAATVVVIISVGVYLGQGVTTAVGEQRLLALEDGTRVFLNTDTRVVARYDRNARRVELKYGEALFEVAKQTNRPFVVQVGDRKVTALGTSFVVRHDDHATAVTLVEGKVAVRDALQYPHAGEQAGTTAQALPRSAEIFTLTPGQRLTLGERAPARLDMLSAEKALAWRRGQVILDDTPLASAVAEMNRYSSVKLVIEHAAAADLLINGLFQAGDSLSFATGIAQIYGLQVIERHNELVLSGLPVVPAQAVAN